MSDLFHPDVPNDFIASVLHTIHATPQHTYQLLTKRPDRMRRVVASYTTHILGSAPLPNLWLGTSVESDAYVWRIDKLRQTPAALRFLSLEPLLGPLPALDLDGIGWLIAGGESGPQARPMATAWARDLRDQCTAATVPFFFKQRGEWGPQATPDAPPDAWPNQRAMTTVLGETYVRWGKKLSGRLLDGRTWDEFPPEHAR